MNGNNARVAVVYNEPVLPPDHPDAVSEGDVAAVAGAVAHALAGSGFTPSVVAAGPPLASFLDRLAEARPEVVFNLVEGFGGISGGATHLISVFELARIPYTGSTVEALAVCVSKARTKSLLRGFGLPTAASLLVERGHPIPRFDGPWPVLVKPDAEDGSLGIDQGSVAVSPDGLAERVGRLRDRFGGPVLIETYLPGPEFNVGVLALPNPKALPVAQVVFASGTASWPILTYGAKWDSGSAEDLSSPIACPAPIDPDLAGRLSALAVAAFRATECRDYARVDFRLDDRGEPMILEVNPNPDIGPTAGFARAARVAGLHYADVLASVAHQARRRGPWR